MTVCTTEGWLTSRQEKSKIKKKVKKKRIKGMEIDAWKWTREVKKRSLLTHLI